MPGVTLCYGNPSDIAGFVNTCQKRERELREILPFYSCEIEKIDQNLCVFLHKHSGHDIHELSTDRWTIYWENPVREIDPEVVKAVFAEFDENFQFADVKQTIERKLQCAMNTAFTCIAIHRPQKTVLFFNDRLARLPLYHYENSNFFLLGRDFVLLRDSFKDSRIDRLQLAQFMLLGYVPGKPSVYADIQDCRPQTFAEARIGNEVTLTISDKPENRVHGELQEVDQSAYLKELTDTFLAATERCAGKDELVLGLSGGLDSRAIGGALHKLRKHFTSFTYRDHDRTATRDIRYAKKLARSWSCPFHIIDLNIESNDDWAALFTMKGGVNYLGVSFFGKFLYEVQRRVGHSNFVFFTGDGGDKVMPDLYPQKSLHSESDFIEYLLKRNSILPLKAVSQALDIEPNEVLHALLNEVKQYPVDGWDEKYRFLLLAERGGRWLFEGEDRNRFFARTNTPFYAYDFYRLAMQAPRSWKKDNRMFKDLLNSLSPVLTKIPNANTLLRIDGRDYNPINYWNLVNHRVSRKLNSIKNRKGNGYLTTHPSLRGRVRQLLEYPEICLAYPGFGSSFQAETLSMLNRPQAYYLYTVLAILNGQS